MTNLTTALFELRVNKHRIRWCFCVIFFVAVDLLEGQVHAVQKIEFNSGNLANTVIELYTSEGCSSCPPAEAWLNQWVTHVRLWKEVIPLAFHVDYWDRLGWKDVYAQAQFSDRQYRYRKQGAIGSVYTPGLVVNGQEWRGWHHGDRSLPDTRVPVGELSAVVGQNQIAAKFSGADKNPVLHVALLGFGIKTNVGKGENKNRKLTHEFVVLKTVKFASDTQNWLVQLPKLEDRRALRYGLAMWISRNAQQGAIQSTGGWIPAHWVEANGL